MQLLNVGLGFSFVEGLTQHLLVGEWVLGSSPSYHAWNELSFRLARVWGLNFCLGTVI